MIELSGVQLPAGYNGIGLHDSPGVSCGVWDRKQAREHARELRDHGVTLYKLLSAGAQKADRAAGYTDEGILTAVRVYQPEPWGRPGREWVTPVDELRALRNAGVQLCEMGGNEPNLTCEWKDGKMPNSASKIAAAVVDAWELMIGNAAHVPGLQALFPALTPGGNVDHRAVYRALAAELARRGLAPTVRHVAIHPRPHNNPPGTPWTETNTVTFDEWRWIRDHFIPSAWYWATEHGTAINDSQNREYPPVTYPLWIQYNWEYWLRMNPAHPQATEPGLAGLMYWYEAGWGHWGGWANDALVDSPTQPAPSELWKKMQAEVGALRFERYAAGPPPPEPPPEPPPGPPVVDLVGKLEVHATKRYTERPAAAVRYAVIHHSATKPAVTPQAMARYHVRTLDWPGIGYHYVVAADGTVYQTNELTTISYHAGKAAVNAESVGVCLVGDFRQHGPPVEQTNAAIGLLQWLGLKVRAHKEIVATQCPGDLRRRWWQRFLNEVGHV